MAKKKKTAEASTPSLETILFNCREYLRSNASLNDKARLTADARFSSLYWRKV